MENISYSVLDSIDKINRQDWDEVFSDIPEGYQFYKTLEKSNLKEFSFYYIKLSKNSRPILIAPLFIADFNLDIASEGSVEKIVRLVRKILPRFLISKTLFCGSPFAEHGALGIRKDIPDKNAAIRRLAEVIEGFCAEKNIPLVVFKDFLQTDAPCLFPLFAKGFFKVNSFPSVIAELNFNSFEQYLSSLGHATRKSLRKKLKQGFGKAPLSVNVTDNIVETADEIFRLYENTYHRGGTKFERLTKEFFLSAQDYLAPHTKFFLYYVNNKLAAFNLCFVYKDLLIDKFIGFDYDIANKYNLYFVSWCFNVDWCIKNSIRFYQVGQTDYVPKIKLGGRLVGLDAYIRHRNKLLNPVLKLLARFLKPDNFGSDIKQKYA